MANQGEIMNSGNEETGMMQKNESDSAINATSDLKNKIRIGVGLLGVIIVAIVAVIFYNKSKGEKEQEASVALSRIRTIFESGDYTKALAGDATKLVRDTPVLGLKDIVEQYGSSENGKVAALYAANSLVSLKKQSEAIPYFDRAMGSSSVEVVVAATIGHAVCKETQNDYLGAAEYYEKAAQLTTQVTAKDKVRLYAALSFEKAGSKEKAEKIYREILHSETMEYISESKSGLTRLGMIVE